MRILFAGTLVFSALGMLAAANPSRSDMVVHEWGTFLAMNGSDGVSLDGMYHEEHALPPFVHARSRDQLRLPSSLVKGETPVIYFYTARPCASAGQCRISSRPVDAVVSAGINGRPGARADWLPAADASRAHPLER